eukprot:440136-Rhodomonas_salina.1
MEGLAGGECDAESGRGQCGYHDARLTDSEAEARTLIATASRQPGSKSDSEPSRVALSILS